MDVTCPRCQTDYEFDDALVSERGTTVKCTNCGHQFRVFRPRSSTAGAAPTPEIWRIERREGEPLELRSLVELQRAIRAGRVGRHDQLRRGDGPPRRVGDIPELEPFFPNPNNPPAGGTLPMTTQRTTTSPQINLPDRMPAHTPAYGKAPAPNAPPEKKSNTLRPAAGVPPPNTPGARAEGSGVERPRSVPPPPPNAAMKQTDTNIRTPLGISPYQPAHEPSAPPPRVPPPSARLNTPLPPMRTPPPAPPPRTNDQSDRVSLNDLAGNLPGTHGPPPGASRGEDEELEPPTQRRIESGMSAPPEDDGSPSRQELYDSIFPKTGRRRRGGLGWIVALVVVAGGVMLAFTVGKPYLAKLFAPEQTSSSAKNDNRLQEALAAGDRARIEGDYTTAREAYLRATVIDDKSMAAWDGYCTAETELAVVHWIAALATGSALEKDQASSIGAAAGKTCQRWSELARATDDGAKKAEADLRAAHAVAAQGNVSATRLYVGAHAGDPIVEVLVLLADATTSTTTGADGGRAGDVKSAAAALAKTPPSSLATPGDVAIAAYLAAATEDSTRAQSCLDELAKRAPRHMLLDTLKQLATTGDAGPLPVPSASGSASATPSTTASTGKVATNDTSTKPTGGNTGGTTPTSTGGESPGIPTGDWRDLDKKGHEALASGDVSKAETMFNGAIAQNPSDIDAMYGLGQIARSRGNHAGAMSYFQQVLDHSPGFSPARLALADEQWSTGNQAGAIANYKIYLESVPTGSGADRARSRIGNVEGTTTAAPTSTP